ncbi:MAG: excinuclease ABC subunit UvrA [Methylicorpusculum sp.]|uniref:excinuclease ABC subunit UvrA n=1 Tax=Methylicorpusculum sp. TaxID=2713644 RepID=UPI0027223693|nr:excinuclease ABC subunit UvrA [Methylicorpusculum sp.]MDO8938420.1 excinuclease ABC subunit UvrA [Methylicorpusculum sp.]MDO9241577.1 excinuclease ABC subunit UvrA [Methylicorpusculum sp.]MDP2202608.1 excinuclease ABC subunit UvrA [Methylicorpusculum sp.]
MDTISIRGARTHNLKNIDLDLPRDQLIVITGLSGSGKSSLAFDTIYAEGQRRYVESLSAYARQFLSMMEKPDVDHIEGLSPAISIEQKSTSHNPRSTVGTITEIYDYLRLLYARAGTPRCPEHQVSLAAQTISQMVDTVLAQPEGQRWMLLAPVINDRKGEHLQLFEDLRSQGFIRARIDGVVVDLDDSPALDPKKKHTIEVIVDRFKVREDISLRLAESFETALRIAEGIALAVSMEEGDTTTLLFSERYACPHCGYSLTELEPRIFSFNNPKGACPGCDGLGVKQHFDPQLVIHNPEISLAGGAIRGWDRRNGYYFQMICSLAEHYGFDPEQPYQELPETIQNILLFGSGQEVIHFKFMNGPHGHQTRKYPFEGIIANMERRYHETDSQMVREELAKYLSQKPCNTCNGARLNLAARNVFINELPLHEATRFPIRKSLSFFESLDLPGKRGEVAAKVVKEIVERLEFLVNVGLDYLTLDRSADTLSGGEAQRIRLASQIGAGLVGVMYVLDEPSIGLHQRDNERLLKTLFRLRDLGNTVIVVEHDEDAIRAAQHVVDIGPGAGVHGGEIVAQGTPDEIIANPSSLTGQYLAGIQTIAIPETTTPVNPDKKINICNAHGNNLKQVNIEIPVGLLTCVTGVSGSGKSTLINDTLYRFAARAINRAGTLPAPCDNVEGLDFFDKVIDIDQSPIGRTPRSNPATYTGIFTPIRELFAATQEARSRGYTPGRFSFNVKGGRCEACKGDGVIKVEMHFLPDIFVNCDNCGGKRYNRETLEIRYKGKTISEILNMTVEDAAHFFSAVPMLARKLDTLTEVGLNYITLGQNAVTLSGGEAQRVKLAKELSKRDTGKTLYILDEPTTGLHFHDIKQLLKVLHTLRDHGNTLVVIEHNLDVIKTADWVIDMGPEGGDGGGMLVAQGTPAEICRQDNSHTGYYLKRFFE